MSFYDKVIQSLEEEKNTKLQILDKERDTLKKLFKEEKITVKKICDLLNENFKEQLGKEKFNTSYVSKYLADKKIRPKTERNLKGK